ADRYERWKLVSIFFALQASGLLMLLLEPVGSFYLVAGGVSGAAHGILFPSLSAMAIDAHPEKFRGVVASVFTGMMELGFSVGSYLLGVVVAIGGFRMMFVATVAVGIFYACYVILFQFRKRRLTQPVQS
ncbi:MAG: MFS transporter, partial [Acidobacteriota bacterium]